jgi:hypothetical protein
MAAPSRAPVSEKPEILFLSLAFQSYLDEAYSSLIDDLDKHACLKRAKAAAGAIRYLEANNPKAILVTDEGLTKAKNRSVLDKVVPYLWNGGLVIIGLHFPHFTTRDVFDKFFGSAFGLSWLRGDYHRTDFQFNPSSTLPANVASASLPAPFSMKVLHVTNARPEEKIFVPVPEATTQSHVFPPSHVDQAQAAIVGAKVGDGYVAYVGDVNGEEGSNKVILSLCGLGQI